MKALKILAVVMMVFFILTVPVMAQTGAVLKGADERTTYPGTYILTGAAVGAGLGVALTILGAGYGFGKIGSSALESMARQPEVAGQIQTAMLIIAALLEGATFFALIVCIIISGGIGNGL